MRMYVWSGLDAQGSKHRGKLRAHTKKDAQELLLKKDIIALFVRQSWYSKGKDFFKQFTVKKEEYTAFFCNNLAMLLHAGLSLQESLLVLLQQISDCDFYTTVRGICDHVTKGSSLSLAIAHYSTYFDTVVVQAVCAGEQSATLNSVLSLLAGHITQKQSFERQLRQAAFLPLLTMIFSSIIMMAVFIFVIPQFECFFARSDAQLPLSTRFVLVASRVMRSFYGIFTLISILVLFVLRKYLFKTPALKEYKDSILARFKIVILYDLVRYLTILALLCRSGTPLASALSRAATVINNTVIRNGAKQVHKSVEQGMTLADSMRCVGHSIFPDRVCSIIALGQRAGTLAPMLEKATSMLDAQLRRHLHRIIMLAQPILVIGVGLCIAFLVLSVYLPLFAMANIV